jgi:hypothetical protein
MVNLNLVKPAHLWYVVGLITTDGNLSPNRKNINITSKDRCILISIKKALGIPNNKVGRKCRGGELEKKYSYLQFSDVNFYAFLESIGLTRRKSLTLSPLKIPQEYFIDFLRGVMDGDGNIQKTVHATNRNIQWTLRIVSGSPYFLPWIRDNIEKTFEVTGKSYIREGGRKNPLYILKYGKFAAKIILRCCYYKNCLTMPRKLKNAQKCIQSKNGLSRYSVFNAT